MPGSRHTPTARPACDTVTAEPGQSLLTRPTAETAALQPPFLAAVRAPRHQQPGGQGETTTIEPAHVTTTAGAQDEPMLSAPTSPGHRRPAGGAPGQPMLAGQAHQHVLATRTAQHAPGQHRQDGPGGSGPRPSRPSQPGRSRGIAWPSLARRAEARCHPAGRGGGLREGCRSAVRGARGRDRGLRTFTACSATVDGS